MPSPIVFDTAPEHVAYALLGCFIMFFGLVSLFVKEKLFISEACKLTRWHSVCLCTCLLTPLPNRRSLSLVFLKKIALKKEGCVHVDYCRFLLVCKWIGPITTTNISVYRGYMCITSFCTSPLLPPAPPLNANTYTDTHTHASFHTHFILPSFSCLDLLSYTSSTSLLAYFCFLFSFNFEFVFLG
jgi:hypothetical protein